MAVVSGRSGLLACRRGEGSVLMGLRYFQMICLDGHEAPIITIAPDPGFICSLDDFSHSTSSLLS